MSQNESTKVCVCVCCDGGEPLPPHWAALGSLVRIRNPVLAAPNGNTNIITSILIPDFFIYLLRPFPEFLAELCAEAGLQPVTNDYVLRETVNRKEGLCVPRVFLQSKFSKRSPPQSP